MATVSTVCIFTLAPFPAALLDHPHDPLHGGVDVPIQVRDVDEGDGAGAFRFGHD